MLLLALDTAGPSCAAAVALAHAGGVTVQARAEERMTRGHAERLPGMVEETLAEAGVSYADIDRVAVTTGPGSFTGVRVGIAFARGLALALDIPVVGVGSLDALAYPLMHPRGGAGTAVAVLDAKRGEVFALARDRTSGETLVEAEALPAPTLAQRLRDALRPLVLTGAGAPLVAPLLEGRIEIAGDADAADIADVAALALDTEDAGPPRPLYARAPDAKPQLGKAVARA